jgi:O-antigen/teichoic acid export membrane protein
MSNTSAEKGSAAFFKDTGWSLLGQVVPIIFAIIAIPILLRTLGVEKFGFLTVAWAVIGYASLFDLGLGRSMTRIVAAELAEGNIAEVKRSIATGMLFLFALGSVMSATVVMLRSQIVVDLLHISPALQLQAEYALLLLALSIPVVVSTAGYTGVLGAYKWFREINIVRIYLGVLALALPVGVSLFTTELHYIVGAVVFVRVCSNLVYALICFKCCEYRFFRGIPSWSSAKRLLGVGMWLNVSNVVGPLLGYLDRLLLGTIVPMNSVAFYTAPYDLLSRTMVFPAALTTVLFPRAASVNRLSAEAWSMISSSTRATLVVMFPVTLACFLFADHALRLWLGEEMAINGALVVKILSVGVLFNALAQPAATGIQANGNPRAIAVTHLIELPVFILLFWQLTTHFGLAGAAVAAATRFVADAAIMFVLACHSMQRRPRISLGVCFIFAVASSMLAFSAQSNSAGVALAAFPVFALTFVSLAWHVLLQKSERQRVRFVVLRAL